MNVQYETAKTYLRRVREKYAKVDRPASKKAELIRRAAEDGYLGVVAKLYFRYGAMNSGKSTALLQAAYNYEERGQRGAARQARDRLQGRQRDRVAARRDARRSTSRSRPTRTSRRVHARARAR